MQLLLVLLMLSTGLSETLSSEPGGRLITIDGRNFSFEVLEPEGWVLETGSALQIAHFIFHPEGTDWRRAEANILARFVPREPQIGLSEFVAGNREHFLEACPFGEEDFTDSPIEPKEGFEIEVYDCPGVRKEIAAVTAGSDYFLVLTLTPNTPEGLDRNLKTFEKIIDSFSWKERKPPRLQLFPPPEQDPGRP